MNLSGNLNFRKCCLSGFDAKSLHLAIKTKNSYFTNRLIIFLFFVLLTNYSKEKCFIYLEIEVKTEQIMDKCLLDDVLI